MPAKQHCIICNYSLGSALFDQLRLKSTKDHKYLSF